MNGTTAYVLSKKFTSDTAIGLGAVKGAPCTILGITPITDSDGLEGQHIIFQWTANNGTTQTSSLDLWNGADGVVTDAQASAAINNYLQQHPLAADNGVVISWADYQALSDAEKNKPGVTYYIPDAPGGSSGGSAVIEEDITVTGTSAGNLTQGTVLLEGTTLTEAFKKMLVKEIPPTYTRPVAGLTLNPSSLQENNTQVTITITPRFTKNDAGNLVSWKLYRGSVELTSGTTTFSSYTDTYTISGNQTYKLECTYAEGPTKKTNLGNDYPTGKIAAGTVNTTLTLNAANPSYYGIVNSTTLTSADITALTKSVKATKAHRWDNIVVNDARMAYAYPKSFGDLTAIKDANNFDYIDSYTKSVVNINSIPYNVYVLTTPTTASGALQNYT